MEKQKKAFYKSKAFIIPLMVLALAGFITAAAIYFQTIPVDITVDEALSAVPLTVSVASIFPGETHTETITVQNDASVPLYTTMDWAEDQNPDGVTYAIDGGLTAGTITLAPGVNNVDVSWTIDEDSPIGTYNGTITLSRVAEPAP